MPIQEQHYQITGMKQDNLVGTGFSTKFAHEIKNMRLNTIGDYTTGAWTTEKGTQKRSAQMYTSQIYLDQEPSSNPITKYFPIDPVKRVVDLSTLKVLGQATINDQWVLFGKITCNVATDIQAQVYKNTDCILRLFILNNKLYCEVLYFGKLNFDLNHPIETLTYFENEDIQKVYFTDGLNQPRVINIVNVKHRFNSSLDVLETQFDFVREVKLEEEVTIKKLQSGSGLFPPCTVKYALTYYDKYGSETNVVYDSPLYYPTKGERGCSPEELSGDSFEITVSNLDTNFDYIRLYSIVRTSSDATPIVRIVADKAVPQDTTQSITFVDTNTTGEIIDPNVLRYVGGRNITAQTFDQKSNALFLGNVTLKTKSATNIWGKSTKPNITWEIYNKQEGHNYDSPYDSTAQGDDKTNYAVFDDALQPRVFDTSQLYPYENQLNKALNWDNRKDNSIDISSQHIKHFKKGEIYRFGLQFQDNYGVWSEVVYIGDSINTVSYHIFTTDYWRTQINLSCPTVKLEYDIINKYKENNFKKVRLVYAKKNNSNRKILAQGVIDATMFEQSTNNENPYRYSSWFFRPKESYYSGAASGTTPLYHRTFGTFYSNNGLFDRPGYRYYRSSDEYFVDYYLEVQNEGYNDQGVPSWRVSRDYLTLYSPELELDESILTMIDDNLDCNPIGYIPISKSATNYYLSKSFTLTNDPKLFNIAYFNVESISGNDCIKSHSSINQQLHIANNSEGVTRDAAKLYPFQNNDMGGNQGYDYKIYSSLLISNTSIIQEGHTYRLGDEGWSQLRGFTPKQLLENGEAKIFKKSSGDNYITLPDADDIRKNLYCGNCNNIAPYVNPYPEMTKVNASTGNPDNYNHLVTKPVSITYNTTTHAVFKRLIKPEWYSLNEDGDTVCEWNGCDGTFFKTEFRPMLLFAEFSRSKNIIQNDIKDEIFVPCSPAYALPTDGPLTIYGLEGDYYFMRYDCLKTYPRSTSDKNQIIEILSFICETRINLDGRYDNKRGLLDNTSVLDTNFNLINKSYTQDNDFYQYTTLDDLSAKLDKFSNQITYTSVKIANEDVDAWTNITLANVDDADGSCGQITKILNINDKLFLFQDHGIARINYDEKTALSTDSGIPIELNSSGKYTGIDYVNKNVGCQNKWSISNTKNGLMWIDDSRRELLALDESFTSITTLNGFDAFMINNCNTEEVWTPNNFNNFITFYDKLSKDIYFINKNTCLAWNEIPKTFTSFYDYDRVSALTTISNHTLMFRNTDRNGSIYAAREANEYSYFFNEAKPYWITLVCDGSSNQNNNFSLDKIFDTIEYRADIYNLNGDNTNYAKSIFNKKHIWNGYQDSEECSLDGIRKFNTWRVQLPRHKNTRDRIRNPFCYIKLKEDNLNDSVQTDRIILHDLAVSYTIK